MTMETRIQSRGLFGALPATLAFVATLTACLTGSGVAQFSVEDTSKPTEWTIKYEGRKVMVYSFAPEKFKPYVKELCTIEGENLLRDAPFDHLHHHALMFAIRVNGINFWEEVTGAGVEKPVKTAKPEIRTMGGRQQAQIQQTVHWVAAQDAFLPDTAKVALLIEERTLSLSVDPGSKEVALHWKSDFQLGGKTNVVTLAGANYYGLGMRFRQDLDPVAVHLLAGGAPDLSDNKQDVSKHAWGAVQFDQPGKPATIVLYGHPSNPRGDAVYFSMRTPFAYLSGTQELYKEPIVYKDQDRFQLHYLVTVHPEKRSSEKIAERGRVWQNSKP
jgi:hypothetical protein